MQQSKYARRSARILLIDDNHRVLLFKSHFRSGHCWMTPGGGIDADEPLHVAAARELQEEVGVTVDPVELGSPVAFTSGYADLGWLAGVFRDDFFVHRVSSVEVSTDGWTELERKHMIGHHWWSIAELTATTETIYPFELAELLTTLVTGDLPADPVRLPWHHD